MNQARNLFTKQGGGVYQFGSKSIYVKIEQDKIYIRTGGGFIGIEEFLMAHTKQEFDKIENLNKKRNCSTSRNLNADSRQRSESKNYI